MKQLTLISKGENTCKALEKQLNDLLGDLVQIEAYYIEGNMTSNIGKDLIVASSPVVLDLAKEYLNPDCPRIVALRAVNYQEIDALFDLPQGTNALLVSDSLSAAIDTISFLTTIGVNHINYYPYTPGMKDYPQLNLAITPDEVKHVPDFVETIINIGNRNIDFITLVEILRILSLLDEKGNSLTAKYLSSIMDLLIKNRKMAKLNDHMKNQLGTIINSVRDGIIAIDEEEHVTVFNPIAEELLGFPHEGVIGKSTIEHSLHKDIRNLLNTHTHGHESFVKINNKQLVINCTLINTNQNIAGRVYTLNDVTEIQRLEEEHRRELVSQQNYARYTLDHIFGKSPFIESIKNLAKKIARSDSPILIQGESGTGKELFAQGIHNASLRKNGPFIAVNFAALSESLLESELFGYEEGAFTGAKKGGMSGLFQQAHKGTIFLDEIGDAPLSFQVKLLRVLQEKQVRRIGSNRVIPIDIRVIVATNKNLKELITKGLFRDDLYYRLNVLPIKLPALRERKEDILILAKHFYRKYFSGTPKVNENDYFNAIQQSFLEYNWPGNIRELQNVVEYLVAISPDHPPAKEILLEELRTNAEFQSPTDYLVNTSLGYLTREISLTHSQFNDPNLKEHFLTLLKLIYLANKSRQSIGRRSLATKTGLTEGIIRGLLEDLVQKGYIDVHRGVKGLTLTRAGIELFID